MRFLTPRKPFRQMGACEKGAAIVEFALVAPMLFLMLMGIVEFGLILFTYSVMEGATSVGSRVGKTGFTPDGSTSREDYIRNLIRNYSGGFLDPGQVEITIDSYNDFSNIGQPETCLTAKCAAGVAGVDYVDTNCNGQYDQDQGRASAGGRGAVVFYRVTYPWKLFTPMMGEIFGTADGIYKITTVATVKNEPFDGGGGGC